MKLYREKIKQADGTIRKSVVWYVEWRDHKRARRRWAGFRDKAASAEFGRRLEQLANVVASGASLTETQARWVDGLPAPTRKRMAGIGMLGGEIVKSSGSLSRHLADYIKHLSAKGNTKRHVRDVMASCRRTLDGIHATDLTQIAPESIEQYLLAGRTNGITVNGHKLPPLSVSWSNHQLTYISGFCRWLVRTGRADRNPLANVSKLNDSADRRHDRAVLTDDQVSKLLQHVKGKPDRYWLYRLALETGLRANELRRLTVGDFDLGESPGVRVDASYAKAKRTDDVPLSVATAKALAPYIAGKHPAAAALVVPAGTARMIRDDLAACKVDYTDEHGRKRDFHALRHTFLTRMGYNVESFADLQALARHSSSSAAITMRYTHAKADAMRRAVELAHG